MNLRELHELADRLQQDRYALAQTPLELDAERLRVDVTRAIHAVQGLARLLDTAAALFMVSDVDIDDDDLELTT